MGTFFIKFFTPFVLMSSIQMHGFDGCLEEERIGLLEIKRFFISINGGEYADEILTSWVDDAISDCCDWERLKCNATTGRVMELSLNYKHYNSSNSNSSSDGAIILDLSLFPPFQELQSLDLSGNWFGGVHESKGTYITFFFPRPSDLLTVFVLTAGLSIRKFLKIDVTLALLSILSN